jgi:hypothetical protein
VLASPDLADHNVPYKDCVSGTSAVIGIAPPTVAIQIDGTGQATHLGRFRIIGNHILNFKTGEVPDGEFTSTAADGSTISGTYSGTFTVDAPDVRTLHLTVLVLEGTDRLLGVTGKIQSTVTVKGVGPEFTFTSEGYLTFPD